MSDNNYWRSGKYVVHRWDCRYRRPGVDRWNWATGKTVQEIITDTAAHGITHEFCRQCCPEAVQ